jgi:HNH endonuclease/NUMOD4 motif
MARETWLPIPSYSLYDVSSRGRVRSWNGSKAHSGPMRLKKPRLRALAVRSDGYVQCGLTGDDGMKKTVAVHRAVLLAFLGEPPEGYQASHMNGRPSDNRHTNLAWEPGEMNVKRQVPDGTRKTGAMPRGEGHHNARVTEDEVREIRQKHAAGASQGRLSRHYGLTRQAVGSIITRRTWAHIEGQAE